MDFNMTPYLVGIVIFIVIGKTILESSSKKKIDRSDYKYKSRKTIMTPHELQFYKKLLEDTKDQGVTIFTKVRLADIVAPDEIGKRKFGAFGRIKSKHIDFVLCDSLTGEIRKCIELNDRSHKKPDRKDRDRFVQKVLSEAGIEIEFVG